MPWFVLCPPSLLLFCLRILLDMADYTGNRCPAMRCRMTGARIAWCRRARGECRVCCSVALARLALQGAKRWPPSSCQRQKRQKSQVLLYMAIQLIRCPGMGCRMAGTRMVWCRRTLDECGVCCSLSPARLALAWLAFALQVARLWSRSSCQLAAFAAVLFREIEFASS